MRSIGRSSSAFLARLGACVRGGVAIWTAVALPPLAVLTVGAVELASISADKGRLQDAADAAALAAARELGVAGPNGVEQRARAYALTGAADVARRQTVTASAALDTRENLVTVQIQANRMSFFGNLLPPGGFNTSVSSSASALGNVPLCVVALRTSGNVIEMNNTSRISATGCLIFGNRDLNAAGGTRIDSSEVQLGGARHGAGTVNPAAMTNAPRIDDPFVGRHARINQIMAGCSSASGVDYDIKTRGQTLAPGYHGGNIKVTEGGELTLRPGVHVFCANGGAGRLEMDHNGALRAPDGVTLFFEQNYRFEIKSDESTSIQLYGSKSGEWAGMLMITPPAHTGSITIDSRIWQRLEGVIYMPRAQLIVRGRDQAGAQSNWTVSVTDRLLVRDSPTLVINSNYNASTVPRPTGVGDNLPRGTRLTR